MCTGFLFQMQMIRFISQSVVLYEYVERVTILHFGENSPIWYFVVQNDVISGCH